MAIIHPQHEEPTRMSEADYLAFEKQSDTRHEFVDGRVFAFAGANWEHVMVVQSTSAALYRVLRGGDCRVGTTDLRLKVASKKVSYRYPDIMVICGDPNFLEDRTIIDNPTLIIEVLSPSTALEDRNAKLDEYRALDSVQDYVLISVNEAKVELFSRGEDEKWLYSAVKGLNAEITLPSIGRTLKLSDIYEQINFTDAQDPE